MSKILIVEDEPIVAQGMSMVLANAGHKIVGIASDEASAVKHAASGRPDLVLMDIQLANKSDGIETARRLQESGPLTVVFVSAFFDRSTQQRAASVNPAGYLVKPYSPDKLLETVTKAERGGRY